jgi:hypothetical protein
VRALPITPISRPLGGGRLEPGLRKHRDCVTVSGASAFDAAAANELDAAALRELTRSSKSFFDIPIEPRQQLDEGD